MIMIPRLSCEDRVECLKKVVYVITVQNRIRVAEAP